MSPVRIDPLPIQSPLRFVVTATDATGVTVEKHCTIAVHYQDGKIVDAPLEEVVAREIGKAGKELVRSICLHYGKAAFGADPKLWTREQSMSWRCSYHQGAFDAETPEERLARETSEINAEDAK